MYGELPRALDLATRVTRLSTGVVGTLTADAGRMRSALDTGFTQAADLAELLMDRFDTDYRTAHRVVSRAVREATATLDAATLARAATEVVGVAWRLDDEELRATLSPGAIVDSRTALGGAAATAMKPMIGRVRARAAALASEVRARRAAIQAAEERVRDQAARLAEPGGGVR
jgi:argininosuccinate lyase